MAKSVYDAGWGTFVRAAGGEGSAVRAVGRQCRPVLPVKPDLLRVRSPGWPEAIEYPGMDVRQLRGQAPPRHQCTKEHPC